MHGQSACSPCLGLEAEASRYVEDGHGCEDCRGFHRAAACASPTCPWGHRRAADNVTIVCLALGVGGPARADTPMVKETTISVEHVVPRRVVHACVIPILHAGVAEVMTASATSELKRPALSRTPAEGLPVQVVHTDADARVHVIPDGIANPSGNITST